MRSDRLDATSPRHEGDGGHSWRPTDARRELGAERVQGVGARIDGRRRPKRCAEERPSLRRRRRRSIWRRVGYVIFGMFRSFPRRCSLRRHVSSAHRISPQGGGRHPCILARAAAASSVAHHYINAISRHLPGGGYQTRLTTATTTGSLFVGPKTFSSTLRGRRPQMRRFHTSSSCDARRRVVSSNMKQNGIGRGLRLGSPGWNRASETLHRRQHYVCLILRSVFRIPGNLSRWGKSCVHSRSFSRPRGRGPCWYHGSDLHSASRVESQAQLLDRRSIRH